MEDQSIKLEPRPCWFVEGENNADDENEQIMRWKEEHPTPFDSDWWQENFGRTGEFIASDADMCSAGSYMIFRSREAAEKYGTRDAAIASGARAIVQALYIDFRPLLAASAAVEDGFTDVVALMDGDPGLLAVFFECSIAIFTDDAAGREAIREVLEALRKVARRVN